MASSAFLLLSPLCHWRGAEQAVAKDMFIRRLLPAERTVVDSSDALLLHHDIPNAAREAFWLCYEFENEHPPDNVRYRRRQDAAFKLMLHAMYAIQILLPIGAANLCLLYRRTEDGPILDCTRHRPPYIGTAWAQLCDVPASFGEDVTSVLDRLHEAFQRPILRLQIPVWLLEQGLSAPDRHIRILLWATGLDGITRSGGVAAFAARICELLGPDTEIFPPDVAQRRPQCKVGEVVEDLYLLRTEMAHGLPFHEKFRKKRGLPAEDGQPVSADFANCRYDQVLEECAAFLLCKALRETFLRGPAWDWLK